MYKIAHVDIENFPNLGYTWEKYEQNVIAFDRVWNIASFAVKWEGDDTTTCHALPDFKRAYKNDPFDDSKLIQRLYDVFDEADMIVGHNVEGFDIRKSNTRFLKHFQKPPSPYRPFDTLKTARKHFYFPSNKLGDLAKFLDCPIGGKVEHEGFGLWLKCMNGDLAAWERMRKYNIQDVDITQWLYHRLRAWEPGHPNITLSTDLVNACPTCGAPTERRGWRYLKTYKARSYHCLSDKCGRWSTGTREKLQPVLT